MNKYWIVFLLVLSSLSSAYALNCPFDPSRRCIIRYNILNDLSPAKLRYYAPTNYDHRISGEINVFDAALVQPYTDSTGNVGQLKLTARRINDGFFKSGEIMTRVNLDKPPYNAPTKSTPFTTNDLKSGYVEAIVKLPKCDTSDDGRCQAGTADDSYTRGLWPSVWMLPTYDIEWPKNGEIDNFEAYQRTRPLNVTTATLHFNGRDPRCGGGGDCRGVGYHLALSTADRNFYNDFHRWGFRWEPDPQSPAGGMIITGYFDNKLNWGPVRTDTLPADGPYAFRRGFHDPNGGFYVITALAVGGGYAGAPNPHIQTASMYLQRLRAYEIKPKATATCKMPVNVKSVISADKKQVTFTWDAPAGSDPIKYFEIADYRNIPLWHGGSVNDRTFTRPFVDGVSHLYRYYLSSICTTGISDDLAHDVK